MRSLDPTEDLAIQLVRRFLLLCEHPRTSRRMLRVIERSPRAGDELPRLLRWLNRALTMGRMSRGTRPISTMKWELVAGQLFAIGTARYLVKLEPIASASVDDIVAVAAPAVLAVLLGPDEVFTSLIVEEETEEDFSDLEDFLEIDEVIEPDPPPRRPPAGGSALRRVH
ncbi:hypothetical protein F0U44_19160 [Nocardioides humilatus]|uniref:Tetracyclin repressor-like C-terminal domain-containing protein n=1 Tax=Nocardioides humilatus TaxID=2607660 RepID=A0A5B1L6X8_9ACTN|nr:hypothetical protein [Nocardioides humilatus]KAA1416433.1 hypothetical protein F0U44_19160 [Nocardioides humilatus]